MDVIMQTTFSNAFSWIHTIDSSIGLDNGLVQNRRQAIIWINNGLGFWRIYASPVLNDLKQWEYSQDFSFELRIFGEMGPRDKT